MLIRSLSQSQALKQSLDIEKNPNKRLFFRPFLKKTTDKLGLNEMLSNCFDFVLFGSFFPNVFMISRVKDIELKN